jgi:predicted MPP superfamily phosphohydrolase
MQRIFFLAIFFILFILIEWYAYQAIKFVTRKQKQKNRKALRWAYLSVALFSLATFFAYNFIGHDSWKWNVKTFVRLLLFANILSKVFLVVFVFIDDLRRGIKWLVRKSSPQKKGVKEEGISRSEFLTKTGIILAALPVVTMSWGVLSGAHDYRVRRINLPIKGLPAAFNGLKIAQLSDIHSGSFWNKTAVEGGIDLLEAENADIAFFTGDLVNNKANEMRNWGSTFERLKAPLGVYSVFGNHDYGDYVNWPSIAAKEKNLNDLREVQKNMGWKLLENDNHIIEIDGEKLGIIGVENWSARGHFPKYGKLDQATKGLEETSLNVLLSHDPSHWQAEVVSDYPKIDLTLSGHTHGMQFGVEIPGFKWSPVQYFYDEWAGLYKSNEQYLYVNRGYGYIGFPGRVGIQPEITILTLEQA